LFHWLQHFFGFDAGQGNAPHYLFFSGTGSDLSELALVGAVFAIVRKHNCHIRHCWRVGRFPVDGTSFTTCSRHHPKGAPTHAEVLAAADEHNERRR